MIFPVLTGTHKLLLALGGGVAVVGTAVALVKRKQAAAIGEQVVAKIKEWADARVPYLWGGRNPEVGLDCSGTVVASRKALGIAAKSWNATAEDLRKQASRVFFPQPGDLALYGSIWGGASHVMTAMGDGKVIGASGGGSSTTTVEKAKAKGAEVKILPYDYRKDFMGWYRLPVVAASDNVTVGGRFDLIGAS